MAPKRSRASPGGGSSPSAAGSSPGSAPGSSPDAEPQPEAPGMAMGGATPDEEEEGEELIGEDMEADYRPMGALDEYEEEGIDHADYGTMDAAARFAAEEVLEQRDARER